MSSKRTNDSTVVSDAKRSAVESDSDDDTPLTVLRERRLQLRGTTTKRETVTIKKESTTIKKESRTSRTVFEKKKVSVKVEKSITPASASVGLTGNLQNGSPLTKEDIVHALVCRWWYAIEWPVRSEIPPTPEGFEPLDGFPGVFFSPQGSKLGTILDLRNKETCPSTRNLLKWPTKKLREICLLAYEKQLEQLQEHEPNNVRLAQQLQMEMNRIKLVSNFDVLDRN